MKIGNIVTVDFITEHPNENSHVQGLSEQERVIVAIYDNGTFLLADLYNNKIETNLRGLYRVSCVIDGYWAKKRMQQVSSKKKRVKENNYKIIVDKMFNC